MRQGITPQWNHRLPSAGRVAVLLLVAVLSSPVSAEGQISALLQAVGNGGSWIRLAVEDGRASYVSPVFPVAGLAVDGCVQVWMGHSGSWTLRAKDTMSGDEINFTTGPGEPARFEYQAGFQAQLDVSIEWSEPRDTTLYMWVGLSTPVTNDRERDICQPPPR